MPDTDAGVVYARKAVSDRAWAVPFVLVTLLTLGFVVHRPRLSGIGGACPLSGPV